MKPLVAHAALLLLFLGASPEAEAETPRNAKVQQTSVRPNPVAIIHKAWTPQRCTQEVGATYLCLRDGRFRVDVRWRTDLTTTTTHTATPVPLNNGSGTFWFFSEDNSELLIKVLDGCGVNGHRWVFFAAVTNVEFTIEVGDLETGVGNVWYNQYGNAARSIQHTNAFLCN